MKKIIKGIALALWIPIQGFIALCSILQMILFIGLPIYFIFLWIF